MEKELWYNFLGMIRDHYNKPASSQENRLYKVCVSNGNHYADF